MLIRTIKRLIVLLALAVASSAAYSANVEHITNGNFQSGSAGWTITPAVNVFPVQIYAGTSCCGAYGTYAYGSAAAFGVNNLPGGTLSQTFSTVIGATYTLSFLYDVFGVGTPQRLQVELWNGTPLTTQLYSSSQLQDRGMLNLSNYVDTYSSSFTAMSALTRLTFRDVSTTTLNTDGILDNVSVIGPAIVAAVPEPSSYALMLAGLGLIGVVARRRNAG